MSIKRIKHYLHGCYDHNSGLAERYGLGEEGDPHYEDFWCMFAWAFDEVPIEADVNTETGEVEIVSVDGRPLAPPIDGEPT